jgi:hypothetical protein
MAPLDVGCFAQVSKIILVSISLGRSDYPRPRHFKTDGRSVSQSVRLLATLNNWATTGTGCIVAGSISGHGIEPCVDS